MMCEQAHFKQILSMYVVYNGRAERIFSKTELIQEEELKKMIFVMIIEKTIIKKAFV